MKKLNEIIRSTIFSILFITETTFFSLLCILTIPLPSICTTRIAWLWSNTSLLLLKYVCNITYKITGFENIPQNTNVIFASKHQSAWETIAYQKFFFPSAFMFKKELLYIPFFGLAMLKCGCIPVNRGHGNKNMLDSLSIKFADRLKNRNIIVFPEGTRTKPNAKPNYKSGLSIITQNLSACIIPVAINSGVFWPKHGLLKHAGVIEVRLLPPIYTGKISHKDFQEKLITAIESENSNILNYQFSGDTIKHERKQKMKKFVNIFVVFFLTLGLSFNAKADELKDVKTYTQNLINSAIVEIFNKNLTPKERVVPFKKIVNENFDFDYISKFVLGVYARSASDEEMKNFAKQFSDINVYSYIKKFENYTDSKIDVVDVKNGKKEGQYFVLSKIRSDNDKDYNVEWRIIKTDNTYKVIDVIIEGVSMALSYRNEYAPLLKSLGSVKALTDKIEEKVISLKLE